jgi:hypothetical protein
MIHIREKLDRGFLEFLTAKASNCHHENDNQNENGEKVKNILSIPQEIKVSVLETIKQRANELLSNMDSCQNLSKFISDIVSEITMTKMSNKNLTGSQFLDSAIVDTMGDDVFRTKLSEKIEQEVCVLFNKYAENAKNLVTKLTSEEV